jgi:type III secretion protein C
MDGMNMTSYRHDDAFNTPWPLRHAVLGFLAWLACAMPTHAASEPDWFAQPYRYRVIDQDVRNVLAEFGRNLSVPVILSPRVKGRIRGDIQAPDAGAFLTRVSTAAGLTWYLNGDAIVVDSAAELASRSFNVGPFDSGALDQLLATLRHGTGVGARLDERRATLDVSGPPGYIAHVQQRLDSLRGNPGRAPSIGVRVFRGGADTEVVSNRS